MFSRAVFIITLVIACVSCGNEPIDDTPQKKDSTPKPAKKQDSLRVGLIYPKRMEAVRKSAYESFYKRIGDSIYSSTYKGRFESSDTTGEHKSFLFDIGAEYIIGEVYFQPVGEQKYFLAWEETDHRGVNSYFAVYTRGKKAPDWKVKEYAPAPGPPVISGDDVYVSTLGMVAKLSMGSGSLAWKHDSLFDPIKLVYKEFNTPLVYNHSVCFYDSPIPGKKNRRDSIWVNDATGKIGK